jgi:predicted 2-oxoglutarate/Fe(II)-dependent dioxygenase YbiX
MSWDLKNSQKMEGVKYHNLEPTYITCREAVKKEVADKLIALVNERGKRSTWAYNPDCVEFQIANPFSKTQRSNDETIMEVLPDLFWVAESFMRHLNFAFGNNVCDIATGHHGFWILRYEQGGKFESHCDWDSGPNGIRPPVVGSVCVLLNDDFSGGETLISDGNGKETIIPRENLSALMWDGFTNHRIAPVTQGTRYALVIHYTGTIK